MQIKVHFVYFNCHIY